MGQDKKQVEDISNALIQLQNKIEQSKGEIITIKEYLSTNERTYDRHFTSLSHFKLQVGNCGLRFSGARFWIEGFDENQGAISNEIAGIKIVKPSACYEISTFDLIDVSFGNTTITLIEYLSYKWVRKTEIIL